MPEKFIFCLVFLSQIILLSYYYPRRIMNRIKYVIETYPPSQYPKLYPRPLEYYERGIRIFRKLNIFILAIGALLLAMFIGDPTSDDWAGVIVGYFFIQFIPIILIEISSHKYYKLMREANSDTIRKAQLQPRRLFDVVSPMLLGTGLFVYALFIVFIVYVKQFGYPWFGGYINILGITGVNLFMAAIIAWNLYGKKRDPHQAHEDRMSQTRLVATQLIYISIAATIFVAVSIALSAFDLHHLKQFATSLYLQLIAVMSLQTMRIDHINFEVYKADPLMSGEISA